MSEIEEWVTGEIKIDIKGNPLDLKVTVPANPTTVRRMLPIFRQMSNSFVEMSVRGVEADGEKVSCKAGCGACCRQPVPISEPEAFEIAELVKNLPDPRRSKIKKRFDDACKHFASKGWFEKLDSASAVSHEARLKVVQEYFEEGIPCPFLEEESCSIHEKRPLACREYLVTSPASNCSDPGPENVKMVPLLVKPSATLCAITKSGNLNPAVNFVPLILSLVWAKSYKEDKTEKSGEGWMAAFFRKLTDSEIPGNAGLGD